MGLYRSSTEPLTRYALLGVLLLGLALSLISAGASAASDLPQVRSVFLDLSQKYYTDRSLDFARELLLKEEYLTALFGSTATELKKRRAEGLDITLLESPLWRLQPAHLDREDSTRQIAPMSQRYQLWRDFEEGEYQRRLELIGQIRSQLISAGSAAQNERMFKRELKTALGYYGRADWEIARLLLDRLLQDYSFHTIDDVLYYLGQTCLQLKLLDCALAYYKRLLDSCPTSSFRPQAYDQATAILEALDEGREIRQIYSDYLAEGAPGDPQEMGGVHIRAAHAEAELERYSVAGEILERVHPKSSYYLAAQYFLADCLTQLKDWSRAAQVLGGVVRQKDNNLPYASWRLLKDEARIKLAYIHLAWGEYDKSAEVFGQVKGNSPFYDRVILGKAWLAFQSDRYSETVAKAEELLHSYPLSSEIYEAGSLAGYCYEQMGDKNTAASHFLDVLQAGVGRAELQSFLEERRRINESMADLQAVEEAVFASGDEKQFSDYKRARNQLWICQQRIGLAELLQVNAKMRDLVAERVALDSLIREHAQLEQQASQTNDGAIIADFLIIEDHIYSSMDHLKEIGQEQLKSTPLYYREAQIGYVNARADSLSRRIESEIERLKASLKTASNSHQSALAQGDIPGSISLGLRMDRLNRVLDQSYLGQTQAETSRRPVLKTRVNRWSDFSFSRYAMGGMDLEDLLRKQERLKQVEDYITTLDELISQTRIQNPQPEIQGP